MWSMKKARHDPPTGTHPGGVRAHWIRRRAHRANARHAEVPTADELQKHANRYVVAGALVVLAAAIAHRTGHYDQQWQYVAIAAALLPQVLLDLLAAADPRRRGRLRTTTRPSVLPLLGAMLLVVGGTTTLLSAQAAAAALAALSAAAGLTIAASPLTVTIAARRR